MELIKHTGEKLKTFDTWSSWREHLEFEFFKKNWNMLMRRDTLKWYQILHEEALVRREAQKQRANEFSYLGIQHTDNGDFQMALRCLTFGIFLSPNESCLVKSLMCQKGEVLRQLGMYKEAIHHLEASIAISETQYIDFTSNISLLNCYKELGNKSKIKETLEILKEFYQKWKEITAKKEENDEYDSDQDSRAEIEHIKREIKLRELAFVEAIPIDIENDYQNTLDIKYEDDVKLVPYLGFSKNKAIRGATAACNFVPAHENFDKATIVANQFIPEGEIVLVDKPVVCHLELSKLQCYHCHYPTDHVIPCFKCQGIFYCSRECQIKDKKYHQHECPGYEMLLFPTLNAILELRLLIQGLEILKNLLDVPHSKFPRKASDFNNLLLSAKNEENHPFFSIFEREVNYGKLTEADFSMITSRAEKLLVYVLNYTNLIESSFGALYETCGQEIEMFAAGMIMRFSGVLILKANRVTYALRGNIVLGRLMPAEQVEVPEHKLTSNVLQKLIYELSLCYGERRNEMSPTEQFMIKNCLTDYVNTRILPNNSPSHSGNPFPIEKIVWSQQNYAYFMELCMNAAFLQAEQHDSEKYKFCSGIRTYSQNYHSRFDFLPVLKANLSFDTTLKALYPTTLNLNHSCEPNLYFVMVSNGVMLMRARRDIRAGEELTISYGPHCIQKSKAERQAALRDYYIHCKCNQCLSDDDLFCRINRIKCDSCIFLTRSCHNCLTSEQSPEVRDFISELYLIEHEICSEEKDYNTLYCILKFCESIWHSIYYDQINYVSYRNICRQTSLFVNLGNPVCTLDAFKRWQTSIDFLFPAMSMEMFDEMYLMVMDLQKLIDHLIHHPLKVHKCFDTFSEILRQTMATVIKAIKIIESYFMYESEKYYVLLDFQGFLGPQIKKFALIECNAHETVKLAEQEALLQSFLKSVNDNAPTEQIRVQLFGEHSGARVKLPERNIHSIIGIKDEEEAGPSNVGRMPTSRKKSPEPRVVQGAEKVPEEKSDDAVKEKTSYHHKKKKKSGKSGRR